MLAESQDMLDLIDHAIKEKRDLTSDEMAYIDQLHERVLREISKRNEKNLVT